jgi:hypothetical protein
LGLDVSSQKESKGLEQFAAGKASGFTDGYYFAAHSPKTVRDNNFVAEGSESKTAGRGSPY